MLAIDSFLTRNTLMLFAPRVPTKQLAEFLRRLSMSLEVGIDVRKALTSEAARCTGGLRAHALDMSDAINRGSSLTAAIDDTGEFFPSLVRQLVAVGEQTGNLPEVLKQLAEHYDEQLKLRHIFTSTIAWPMIQLGMALAIVGFLIWIAGVLPRIDAKHPNDLLGFGLTGEIGLLIYLLLLSAIAGAGFVIFRAIATGKVWVAPLQHLITRLPVVGTAVRTLALARFAWTLQLTTATALDVKRAISLSLQSTRNAVFIAKDQQVQDGIQNGESIHDALTKTGIFPIEFLHAVQVGEESGRLSETMEIIARQQLDAARRAMAALTKVAGYGVWLLVAGLIITLIFRLAGVYIGNLNQALNMGK
jgi:type IV pilus assembly protein PilC